MGPRREEHRCVLAQRQKVSSGEYDQANQRCGEVIAKIKQPGESPERSSSSLVVVVCMHPARLPIQLSYRFPRDLAHFPVERLTSLTTGNYPAYPEPMPSLHILCCCRRSPLAHTEARRIR
jgi:hypothetical protein